MTNQPRAGMDHDLYDYIPITKREPLWLDDKRIGIYVVLHLEHWELSAPHGSHRDPRFVGEFGTYAPEFRNWTYREYGNRVGIYRLLELMSQLDIVPTVAMGAALVQTHPELVQEISRLRLEVVAHGYSANRMITSKFSEDEERAFIIECRDTLAQALGHAPEGWLGQDFGATWRTPALLHEAGFTHTLDWSNDDLPYWLRAGHIEKGLVAIPGPTELDDVQTLHLRRVSPTRYPFLVKDMLEGMASASSPRICALGVHPWMIGAPHRIRYLREALEAVRRRPDVLTTTAGEIARRFTNLHQE